MAIRTNTGYVTKSHAAPTFPFWVRVMARVEGYSSGSCLWSLSDASAPVCLRLFTNSGGALNVSCFTSWGDAAAGVGADVGFLEGTGLASIVLEFASASSVTVHRSGASYGPLDITNPNSAELSGVDTVTIGALIFNSAAAGSICDMSAAEYAEGTGTLTGPQLTSLLDTTVKAEEISGLTLVNVVPMNPAGSGGDDAPDTLTAITGGNWSTSAAVTISARTHPVTRSGGDATANGATVSAAASLVAGSASGTVAGTATGATLTAAASLVAGSASGVVNGTLDFQAAGMEFGARTGLGISTFALDDGVSYRYTIHADGLTLGSALFTSTAENLDSAGKLANYVGSAVAPGTQYRVCAIRQTDGEAAIFRMVAA